MRCHLPYLYARDPYCPTVRRLNPSSTPNITQDESFVVSVSLRSNGDGHSLNGNYLPLLLVPEPVLESVSLNHTQSRVGGYSANQSFMATATIDCCLLEHDGLHVLSAP